MKPYYKILYNGKKSTKVIDQAVSSLTYNFAQTGRSDEIEITLSNFNSAFLDELYPSETDFILLFMGYENGNILNCGQFLLDAPQFDLYDKKVYLKGTSTKLNNIQCNYTEHKETNLNKIVEEIAKNNSLKLKGSIDTNINISSRLQSQKTDAQFLNELATDFGYIFKIDGEDLIFLSYSELESKKEDFTIKLDNLLAGSSLTDSRRIYQFCTLKYTSKGKTIEITTEDSKVKNGLILNVEKRVESESQGKIIASAQLKEANRERITGRFVFQGEPKVAAGSAISLTDAGKLSGKYCVKNGTHSISSGEEGFITSVEVYKI